MVYCGTYSRALDSVATVLLALAGLLATVAPASAADATVERAGVELQKPVAIAARPQVGGEGYEIYIADVGAGKIIRVRNDKLDAGEEAIVGFATSADDDDRRRLPGPHGLLFLDANRLVVTGSERPANAFVRLYELADPSKPLTAEQHEQQASPSADAEQAENELEAFFGLARTRSNDHVSDYLVLSAIGRDDRGRAWRLPVRGGTLGDFKLMPIEPVQDAAAPLAVAVEPRGHIVVARPIARSKSSELAFVNPIDGQTVIKVSVNLAGIVGLAYSPRSGNLYAIGRQDESRRDGVYRIDAAPLGETASATAVPTKIAEVEGPTALAFGPDAVLYVTTIGGTGNAGPRGALMKIDGEL